MAAGGVLVGRGYVSIRPEFEGDWSRSVNTRASSAGRSGASAFGKAFSAGLKGVGALAGVAIAANLSSAAAGAAALAPALATAGAAAGALKLGLSGVGDAFKAAFADQSADANAAASATRAVESAQRGLAKAQQGLADARVQAAERVREAQRAVADAEQNLARTVEDSARRQADAQRQVQDAERSLRDAQKDALQAQQALNGAREDASRALQDMNTRLAESRLDEKDAVLRLADAERALRAAQQNPGVTPEQLAKLQLAYDRAKLNLQEQRTETKRLSEDTKKANKAGVEGSDQVTKAKERIADANKTVADRERALADAQRDSRQTAADNARQIADAQRQVADAQADVSKARQEGARQIRDAEQAVADAAQAVADAQAAAAAQTSKLDQAMSKLSPNAQSFVRAVQGLQPAWDGMRLAVQNELFKGLDTTVSSLASKTIPILKEQLTATAGIWNHIAKNAAAGVQEMAKSGMLRDILKGANDNLRVFQNTPKQLITAFGQLTVAAQPAFNGLLQQFAGAITSFTDGIAASFKSGGLQDAITTAFGILQNFGTLLGNAFGVVTQIFKAASDAGGQIVGVLGSVFGELRRILAAPEMQASLRTLFASVAQIVGAIVPVIGSVVQAIVPLLAAVAPFIAQLAQALGPVLQELATTLGAVLMPIVQALGPVLVTVGTAIIQIVQAVMPLLQPIATLIAAVVNALAPALTPIISVVTSLVGVLVGPLTQVVQTLTPVLVTVGQIIAQVFQALEPFLTPLVNLLGQVAGLIAGVFASALTQLMGALQPLIPIGLQLITTVLDALTPILPTLGDAFAVIAQTLTTLLGPLAAVWGSLAQQLAPILGDLAPLLGQIAGLFASALAQILPPLADAFLQLVTAVLPILPLFAQIVGMVLEMASGVLMQLMPSILQLVQAAVQLIVALLPILPVITQLVELVVKLAVNVLSWLLPPLLKLAGFLVGVLAGALSTVIGWVAGLVKIVANLIGWVVDHLVPAFTTLKDKGIQAWNLLRVGIAAAWGIVKNNILYPLRDFFTKTVPGWGTTLKNKVTGAWSGLHSGISNAWGKVKTNVLYPLRDFFTKTVPGWGTTLKNKLIGAFDLARAGIKKAWDKIQSVARKPVQYVVDVVYNSGLRGVWNTVAGAFGAKKLPVYKFASGGVLPGYTPGRDVHRFVSPTGGRLELSGGEAIMRPEFTKAVGSDFVNLLNQAARQRGTNGVAAALAPALGGNPATPTDRSLKYASGGIYPVQRYADGGIFGWIGKAANKVAGAGSAAWNAIKKVSSWLKDGIEASARAGVKNIVDPLLKKFPGADTGFGKMIRSIPNHMIDTLFGYAKKADGKGGGGIGGPRIQAALKWAKTQAGKPYQWAGNGNPSWDCSGFMSAIESVIRGQKPHRRWATMAFHGKTAPPGWVLHGNSPFRIGITNAGVGHTAGTLGKTNVESRGGDGVIVGKRARGYNDRLFGSWYGFQPGKYDAGGFLQPGFTLAYNGTGRPEPVLTGSQFNALAAGGGTTVALPDNLRLVVDGQEFHAYVDTRADGRVKNNNQRILTGLNAGPRG